MHETPAPAVESDVPESSWNYRVTRTKMHGEYVFEIREVYYTHGQPHSWSRDPIAASGESSHELAEDLVKMQRAVSMPVLDLTGDKPRDMPLQETVRSRVTPPGDETTASDRETAEKGAPGADGMVTIHGRTFHMTEDEKAAAANPAWRTIPSADGGVPHESA